MPLKFMVLMTSVLVVTAADGYAYSGLFDNEISRFVPLSDIGPETDNRKIKPEQNVTVASKESLQRFIVQRHNELRASVDPPAANMRTMIWDEQLAKFAEKGAQCQYFRRHRSDLEGYGENLNGQETNYPLIDIKQNILNSMNYWWNENRYYNYEDASCSGKTCGHYTQMAWASTARVGCAWRLNCPLGNKDLKYNFMLVCDYKNPGNTIFDNPLTRILHNYRPYKRKNETHARGTTASSMITMLKSPSPETPKTTTTTSTTPTPRITTSSTHMPTTTTSTTPTPRITTPSTPMPTTTTSKTPTPRTTTSSTPMPTTTKSSTTEMRITEGNLISCITFENGWDHVRGPNGLWVKNNGVRIISSGCIHKNCGYFSHGATLEIPFFKNKLTYHSFSVSFFFKSKTGTDGLLWNGCQGASGSSQWNGRQAASGSSLAIDAYYNVLKIKMNDRDFMLSTTALIDIETWHHFVLSWDGSQATVYIDKVQTNQFYFQGQLQSTFCPLIIGRTALMSFSGLMDEISFYRSSLSKHVVEVIYDRHISAQNTIQPRTFSSTKFVVQPTSTALPAPASSVLPNDNNGKLVVQPIWSAVKTDPPKVLTCVTFENGWDHVQGTKGIYVKNDGVEVVSGDCIHGNCGYFDGHSFLAMPFFKGNLPEHGFSASFFFKRDRNDPSASSAMISNQCVRQDWYTHGLVVSGESSLSISLKNGRLETALTNEQRDVKSVNVPVASYDNWHHYALSWDGRTVSVYIDSVLAGQRTPFPGHLNRIICSMHIGLGAAELSTLSFFHGRLDEVCILKGALSDDDVRKINKDPSYINRL